MTGSYEASKKRGFADSSTEVAFCGPYIARGQPKKAPVVLRTDDQLSMFFKSESKSILLIVVQRIAQFDKGSVNILMEKMKSLVRSNGLPVQLSSMSTQSSASCNSKSSNDRVSKEPTRTVIPSHSKKRQRVT